MHWRGRRAALEVDVTGGQIDPLPIAIPAFIGDSRGRAQLAPTSPPSSPTISAARAISGRCRPKSFIEQITDFDQEPRFGDWRQIQAKALVTGQVDPGVAGGSGRSSACGMSAPSSSSPAFEFTTSPKSWRRLGHLISDKIYKAMTGMDGYFDTRIVFVDEIGPKDKRVKRLADHGSGRLQRAHAHRRQAICA